MKSFYPKSARLLSLLLALLLTLSLCIGCDFTDGAPSGSTASQELAERDMVDATKKESPCIFTLVTPTDLSLHTELQQKYLNDSYSSVTKYANGNKELSAPAPVKLSWKVEMVGTDSQPTKYRVTVGKKADLSDGITYSTIVPNKNIYNLEIGTTYYWNVGAVVDGKTWTSETASFQTGSRGPRTLTVTGVKNVRDLGGYVGLGGALVRQGLLYRCARLNTNGSLTSEIEASGVDVMLNFMKVKTEIDLREDGKNGVTSSPLGNTVRYVHCPMLYEFSDPRLNDISGNLGQIKNVFHLLSDETNYPLFFHCSIGTDRTGAVAFLVLALLGVDQNSIYRDYLFSNFADIGGTRSASTITNYINMVSKASGSTLAEKTYHYLIGIGIPASELDSIRNILLEK